MLTSIRKHKFVSRIYIFNQMLTKEEIDQKFQYETVDLDDRELNEEDVEYIASKTSE